MEFFADWHTHSTYSDGRGTIEENAIAAIGKKMEEIAVTDHCPNNIWAGVNNTRTYRQAGAEIKEINKKYPEITVKTGAEADIIAHDGTIDLPREIIESLDILVVGLHPFVRTASIEGVWSVVGLNLLAQAGRGFRERARINNTKALKEALFKYDIDIISHPNLKMPVDVYELAQACAVRDTAIEINVGHHYDKEDVIRHAEKTGVNFVVSSDAHFPSTIGELKSGGELLEKFNIPPERVINARKQDY